MFVGVGFETLQPPAFQFYEADVVAFHVIDSLDGDSARGDYGGRIAGIVRPRLKWTTRCLPAVEWSVSPSSVEAER